MFIKLEQCNMICGRKLEPFVHVFRTSGGGSDVTASFRIPEGLEHP